METAKQENTTGQASGTRQAFLRQPFVLPPDVVMLPVEDLSDAVRQSIACERGDWAVQRPGYRSTAKVVNRATAALLEEFRSPTRISEAVVRQASLTGTSPRALLEAAFPVLTHFSESMMLVPVDSMLAESIEPSLHRGQCLADYTIVQPVQVLQDTELYQATHADGHVAALKIMRQSVDSNTAMMLERERAVLEHLQGSCSPRLINTDTLDGRTWLSMQWISAVPISIRAAELRSSGTSKWREHLHQLGVSLIEAYTRLHEGRVLHGDIHNRNVLVDSENKVSLVDFGLAGIIEDNPAFAPAGRSPMIWFMEPEAAVCQLHGEPLPNSSFRGEQYSVAALLYYLICGSSHVKAPSEQVAFLSGILAHTPVSFVRQGFESWPAVEAVLGRAMAQKPADRFPSMRAFGNDFDLAMQSKQQSKQQDLIALPSMQPWFRELGERVIQQDDIIDVLYPQAPRLSVHAGAAGLAWAIYRASQCYDSAALLTSADVLCRKALIISNDVNAFHAPCVGMSSKALASGSQFHTVTGLWLTHALVCHARGDLVGASEHLNSCLAKLPECAGTLELFNGRSGLLLGASILLESLRLSNRLSTVALEQALAHQASLLWQEADCLPAIGCGGALPHLGMAHGWAGVLFAQLRIHELLDTAPPASLETRLDQLSRLAVLDGRGACWPGTPAEPVSSDSVDSCKTLDYAPGWCAGTAGFVHLWIQADRCHASSHYQQLARMSAWHSFESDDATTHVCCGQAGRAWSQLAMYQHFGDAQWLEHARSIALRAVVMDSVSASVHLPEHADKSSQWHLFRGSLGLRLLLAELDEPESAVMPLFGV